jgi:hypothetical protein
VKNCGYGGKRFVLSKLFCGGYNTWIKTRIINIQIYINSRRADDRKQYTSKCDHWTNKTTLSNNIQSKVYAQKWQISYSHYTLCLSYNINVILACFNYFVVFSKYIVTPYVYICVKTPHAEIKNMHERIFCRDHARLSHVLNMCDLGNNVKEG